MINIRKYLTPALAVAAAFLLLELFSAGTYGFFGDELYYIACSKHLDFGYVDHPPLVALIALISRLLFGETLFGLRLMAGLAGAAAVLTTAAVARELGGGRFAQFLSALSILFVSSFPAIASFFSMNVFDYLICALCALILIRILNGGSAKLWLLFGFVAGIGLLNKYTLLNFGFGVLVGLAITPQRKWLATPWPYLGGMIAAVMFLPHLIWQITHDWPTLEFMYNAHTFKNNPLSVGQFLLQMTLGLNPLTLPLWVGGLSFLFIGEFGRKYRMLGITAVVFLLVYILQGTKFYYVVPIFPLVFAAGAVGLERITDAGKRKWIRPVAVSVLIVSGGILMPLVVPMLPVESFIRYSKAIGLWDHIKMERNESETLPLHFVHRFGWEELVQAVDTVYQSLPDSERSTCAILTTWYGPAGAIDHFGSSLGLPPAICGRNNYYLWGPRGYTGDLVLTVGYGTEELHRMFDEVQVVTVHRNAYADDYLLAICRKPKLPLDELWPHLKVFI